MVIDTKVHPNQREYAKPELRAFSGDLYSFRPEVRSNGLIHRASYSTARIGGVTRSLEIEPFRSVLTEMAAFEFAKTQNVDKLEYRLNMCCSVIQRLTHVQDVKLKDIRNVGIYWVDSSDRILADIYLPDSYGTWICQPVSLLGNFPIRKRVYFSVEQDSYDPIYKVVKAYTPDPWHIRSLTSAVVPKTPTELDFVPIRLYTGYELAVS